MDLGAKVNLVVCQKSKLKDWVEHFDENYSDCWVYDLSKKKQFDTFIDFSQCETDVDLDEMTDGNYPDYFIGVINYDLVWRRSELENLENFTLMLDESSLIQVPTSNRSQFVMKLSPKNVILLSGTPTGGKYERLLTQMNLLGWNISEKTFWNQYVDWEWQEIDGYWQKKILGYKNEERLKRKMRQHGCNFLKTEDVMDLPLQNYIGIDVPITSDYKKFKKNKIISIDGVDLVGDNILNCMLYERQLCGQYNQNKIKACKDLIESTEDRLVIFYNFTEELVQLKHLSDALCRDSSIVNGQFKDLYAYENKNDSVTFVQYQTGAMGLNLQKANKIIYFTPPLSSELFEQSKKRIHRIGQDKPCFYYKLVCSNSIEEKIYNTLAMRRDYTDRLFEEQIDG